MCRSLVFCVFVRERGVVACNQLLCSLSEVQVGVGLRLWGAGGAAGIWETPSSPAAT